MTYKIDARYSRHANPPLVGKWDAYFETAIPTFAGAVWIAVATVTDTTLYDWARVYDESSGELVFQCGVVQS